ncbi:MAG: hypothetical protein ABSA30_09995 [Candidatus Aminicenantales bacterium]
MADKKVLIVDYDARSVDLIARLLQPYGLKAETAADAGRNTS